MSYSPILSIVTAAIEITAAVWVLKGPGRKPVLRVTAAVLLILAAYQLLEVWICTLNTESIFLPRLAFWVVAWLPPTGLLLIALLRSKPSRILKRYAGLFFVLAAFIGFWVLLDSGFVADSVCMVVFAKFTNPMPKYLIYCSFYWLGLLSMILLSGFHAFSGSDQSERRLIRQVFYGTLAFIVPSLLTIQFLPTPDGSLPSILCHFALLLALFLVRMVWLERRKSISDFE
ncbi:MAG TPA: hypothetical protein ENN03_07840 [bacterium]|nr:hypothetical protein [bacterium]